MPLQSQRGLDLATQRRGGQKYPFTLDCMNYLSQVFFHRIRSFLTSRGEVEPMDFF